MLYWANKYLEMLGPVTFYGRKAQGPLVTVSEQAVVDLALKAIQLLNRISERREKQCASVWSLPRQLSESQDPLYGPVSRKARLTCLKKSARKENGKMGEKLNTS